MGRGRFDSWIAREAQRRVQTGAPRSRQVARLTWYQNPPGADPGHYVAVDYVADWERQQECGYLIWFRPDVSTPFLLSRQERFDPAAGIPFFGYLTLSMLLVERDGASSRPLERDGAPVLVPFNRVAGLQEQIGRNTGYVIHAEEILASNVELLVQGVPNAPSPEVLERMRAVLVGAARR